MKKECKIVRELIQSYINETCEFEASEYIKGHLEKCEECKCTYELMREPYNIEDKLKV